MADIEMRVGDTWPPLDVMLYDGDGAPADTIGATSVVVRLVDAAGAEVWSHPGVVDNATQGRVTYQWVAGDTDNTADGLGLEYVLTYPAGVRTLPTEAPQSVAFRRPLAAFPLPLQPEEVARETGITLPLTDSQRTLLAAKIRNVAGEMNAALGYWPSATTYTEQVLPQAYTGGKWQVDFPPVVQVISQTVLASGEILLVYRGGFDVEVTAALRSYLVEHAAARYRGALPAGSADRAVSSVSVEGQSVSYATPGAGEPGSLPTLDTIRRYRRVGVYSRPVHRDPFADVPTGIVLDQPVDAALELPPGWYPVDVLDGTQ